MDIILVNTKELEQANVIVLELVLEAARVNAENFTTTAHMLVGNVTGLPTKWLI